MRPANLSLAIVTRRSGLVAVVLAIALYGELGNADLVRKTNLQQSVTMQTPDAQKPAVSRTFVGTIMKSGAKYVLKTIDHGTYLLDDQSRAEKFNGKVVEVIGNLDANNNTIQVEDIKAG